VSPNAVAVLRLSGYICAECIPEVVRYLRSHVRREHRVEWVCLSWHPPALWCSARYCSPCGGGWTGGFACAAPSTCASRHLRRGWCKLPNNCLAA